MGSLHAYLYLCFFGIGKTTLQHLNGMCNCNITITYVADASCRVHALRPAAAGKKGKPQQQQLSAVETAKEFHMSKSIKKGSLAASGAGAPMMLSAFKHL